MTGAKARMGWRKPVCLFPRAANPAMTFGGSSHSPAFTSCQLPPELLIPGECAATGTPCFSVTTKWGWHCSGLHVLPFLY